ncbi:MAG: TetR/AcrR family transcriptional regulator [Coriobacteriales bacterium]|jgi:probable dihydroxyacetone kinase regulator|nr:TetR/AcrR family transcriptional regulator [Coriobacteriales bacterium]
MNQADDTKQVLAEALRELLRTQPLQKVTVRELCELAGMSRKTFYHHFADKYNLVNWICYTEFIENQTEFLLDGGWKAAEAIGHYFEKDRQFYGHALQDMSQNSFGRYFCTLLEVVITNTCKETIAPVLLDEKTVDFMAAIAADTTRRILADWLLGKNNASIDELFVLMHKATRAFAAIICSGPLSQGEKGPCEVISHPLKFDRTAAGRKLSQTLDGLNAV